MRDTCKIHAGCMRDTCILRGNQDTCEIHAEYMRDTFGIHLGYLRDTYLGGVGGMYRCHQHGEQRTYQAIRYVSSMYPYVSYMYLECILCFMYLRVKIHCILNVSQLYPKCILKKDTYPKVRYISILAKEIDTNVSWCILVYLDVS